MNNSDSKTISKIPILSSIPIIGEFFKNTSTTRDRHEMIILITPTIVSSEDEVKVSDKLKQAIEGVQEDYSSMEKINPNRQEQIK